MAQSAKMAVVAVVLANWSNPMQMEMKMTSQTLKTGTLFGASRAKSPRSGSPWSRLKAWKVRALAWTEWGKEV